MAGHLSADISPIDGLTCDPIQFAHDRLGSHGFVVDGFGYRIGYATDLGHVPSNFFDRFRDLDCIALESNYDPQMQADSARPWFLKRRITGGHGHLSNLQACAAISRLLDRARQPPDHIALARALAMVGAHGSPAIRRRAVDAGVMNFSKPEQIRLLPRADPRDQPGGP